MSEMSTSDEARIPQETVKDPATTKSAENTRTPVKEKHIPRRVNGNEFNKGLFQLASSKGPSSIPVIESISLRT